MLRVAECKLFFDRQLPGILRQYRTNRDQVVQLIMLQQLFYLSIDRSFIASDFRQIGQNQCFIGMLLLPFQ